MFRFSINFCLDNAQENTPFPPKLIAYQFRTSFHENGDSSVVHTFKKGDERWGFEINDENSWIDDRGGSKKSR